MQYAAHLPTLPSTRRMVAPVVALVVGAAAATGTYALIDNGASVQPAKVIVVERPAAGSAQIPGKNEAAPAAAISPKTLGAAEIPGKNEAGTAAAISPKSPGAAVIPGKNEAATAAGIASGSHDLRLRGSKASTSSLAGTSSQTFDGNRQAQGHRIPPGLH